jgi:two-component system response regulator FixJ
MSTTVLIVNPDPDERKWIASVLASAGLSVVFVDNGDALLARLSIIEGACLIACTEPCEATALELVRNLRSRGVTLPVIVIGPHSAFRTAVDIARLASTDFLERPVSAQELLGAVGRARSVST